MQTNVVVFSKDRPAQLDLCLSSFAANFYLPHRVSVIYRATEDETQQGYERAKELHPGVKFVDQSKSVGFRSALNRELIPVQLAMFLVDDIVFTRPVRPEHPEIEFFTGSPNILTLSLRLGDSIKKCYALGDAPTPPQLRGNIRNWEWHKAAGDWAYPMSLDGNIFRAGQIYPLMRRLQYSNPNELEAQLASNPIHLPKMSCYTQPRLVNIPHNRVQDQFTNRCMGNSAQELNAAFLAGKRLSFDPFAYITTETVHAELPFTYRKTYG